MRYELEKYVYKLNQIIKDFDGSASKNDPIDGEGIYIKAIRAVIEDLNKILEGPK